jgi:hypothetical protein
MGTFYVDGAWACATVRWHAAQADPQPGRDRPRCGDDHATLADICMQYVDDILKNND